MEASRLEQVELELRALARKNRQLTAVSVLLSGVVIALAFATFRPRDVVYANSVQQQIRTRAVVIVDDKGTERVWIGAPLPDQMKPDGTRDRLHNGQYLAGILLYDKNGRERSGYFTEDGYGNVAFTLDTANSTQQAFFIADPEEGAALRVWHKNNSVDLRADSSGPKVKMTREGTVVFEQPIAHAAAKE